MGVTCSSPSCFRDGTFYTQVCLSYRSGHSGKTGGLLSLPFSVLVTDLLSSAILWANTWEWMTPQVRCTLGTRQPTLIGSSASVYYTCQLHRQQNTATKVRRSPYQPSEKLTTSWTPRKNIRCCKFLQNTWTSAKEFLPSMGRPSWNLLHPSQRKRSQAACHKHRTFPVSDCDPRGNPTVHLHYYGTQSWLPSNQPKAGWKESPNT